MVHSGSIKRRSSFWLHCIRLMGQLALRAGLFIVVSWNHTGDWLWLVWYDIQKKQMSLIIHLSIMGSVVCWWSHLRVDLLSPLTFKACSEGYTMLIYYYGDIILLCISLLSIVTIIFTCNEGGH